MDASSSRGAIALLGGWLAITIALAFVFLGGVGSGVQAALHVAVAAAALLALGVPDRKLEVAGATIRWAIASMFPVGALALGLIPVPRGLAAWVAPGLLEARPDAPWLTLATDPGRVPGEIATLVLILGFGAMVTTWGASRFRRDETELVLVVAVGLMVAFVLGHAALGARAVLGVAKPEYDQLTFFAPFVNRDHAAAIMLLGGPIAMGLVLNGDQPAWSRAMALVVALVALATIVWVDSGGAAVAAVAVAVLWMLRSRDLLHAYALVAILALAAGVRVWIGNVAWMEGSVIVRANLWRDSLRMAADHWLAGTGGGTFDEAILAYRSDHRFLVLDHAHCEPLEWVAETGLVGAAAAALAAVKVWPGAFRDRERGNWLIFGLVALGLHSLVDFPLQIPVIAMAAAAVAAIAIAVYGERRPAAARAVRLWIVAIGIVQVPAAAWRLRDALIDRAKADVEAFHDDPDRAARGARMLERARGGDAERLLFEAWTAESRGDADAALAAARSIRERHPDRPDALRRAALVLARARKYGEARSALERVTERDPADYRAWVVLARIAHAEGDDRQAADLWSNAFQRSAPGFAEAYDVFPVGLYWLQSLNEADARYSMGLAERLIADEDYESALLACEQAARLDPVRYGEALVRSVVLVKLGRAREAEAWLAEILARRPDKGDVLAEYGRVLEALGRPTDATEVYLRGSRTTPELRVRALRSAEAAGGPPAVLDMARRFEIDGVVDPQLALEIAGFHHRHGDSAACVREIERWGLASSTVGPRAAELLEACRQEGR